MSATTRFLSRLIGIYAVVVSLALAIRGQSSVITITAMVRYAPLMFFCGFIALIAGLAIVLNHNVWSGGAAPVIVTIIGWLAIVKGVLILLLTPDEEAALFIGGLHYAAWFYFYLAVFFLVGVFLTVRGFQRD